MAAPNTGFGAKIHRVRFEEAETKVNTSDRNESNESNDFFFWLMLVGVQSKLTIYTKKKFCPKIFNNFGIYFGS